MMKFILATKNKNKVIEFGRLLESAKASIGEYELLSLKDIDFDGEIDENGSTFEENALIKARSISKGEYITFADDSGLSVDALDGAPGIYSARYSGGTDEDNNDLLLKNLEGKENRRGEYVCAIACVFPDKREFVVRGTCEGEILTERHGNGGFGYDPLFYIPSLGKTFAEISLDEKNKLSHRGKASKLFLEKLIQTIKESNK